MEALSRRIELEKLCAIDALGACQQCRRIREKRSDAACWKSLDEGVRSKLSFGKRRSAQAAPNSML